MSIPRRRTNLGRACIATAMAVVFAASAAFGPRSASAGADAVATGPPEAIVRAMAEVPADAAAVAVVPHLSRTAGRLDGFLAGMDRAGLLLGADPVDQVMGLLGFNRHVDRFGAAVAAWVPGAAAGGGEAGAEVLLVLVPSSDPAAFIDANFQPSDRPGIVRDASGRSLAVRAAAGHVVLAAAVDAAVLERAGMGLEAARARLGSGAARGIAARGEDDLLILLDGPGLAAATASAAGWARGSLDGAVPGSPLLGIAATLVEAMEPDAAGGRLAAAAGSLAIGVRFDPLGLLIEGRMDWAAAASPAAGGGRGPGVEPLAEVPAGPMILAAGWDRGDAAATASLDRMREILGIVSDPRWGEPERISLHLPRHGGGFAGGLLAGASLRVRGEAAAAAAGVAGPWLQWPGFAVDVVRSAEGAEPGRWRLRRTGEGGSPGGALLAVLLAGPQGGGGRLWAGDGAVEARVGAEATTPATTPATEDGAGRLADDFAIDLMRQLRSRPAVLEVYLDAAAASRWLAAAAAETPLLPAVPAIDAELPPVGLGVDADDAGIGGSLVVPAPLAAVAWDAILARLIAGPAADAAP